MKKYLSVIVAGGVSGIINTFLVNSNNHDVFDFTLSFFAGVPYGLLTGWSFCLFFSTNKKLVRSVTWTIVSAFSYKVAFLATSSARLDLDYSLFFSFTLGGFVGSLILCSGFNVIFKKLSALRQIIIMGAGTVLPAFIYGTIEPNFGSVSANDDVLLFCSALYLVWQTSMTILFVYDPKKACGKF